jgi:hypothetical protein
MSSKPRAGKGKDEFEPVSPQHNMQGRAEIIRSTMAELDRIDDTIKELQAAKSTLKNTCIKGSLGMKVTDFNIARRFYKLETDDRDMLQDCLRETFAALNLGEQSNFLDALSGEGV